MVSRKLAEFGAVLFRRAAEDALRAPDLEASRDKWLEGMGLGSRLGERKAEKEADSLSKGPPEVEESSTVLMRRRLRGRASAS